MHVSIGTTSYQWRYVIAWLVYQEDAGAFQVDCEQP